VASDGTTAVLSESGGTVTIDADVSTIGSATISGGSITGTEIDLKSSGTTIFASDGTTAVLSESGGAVTLTADEANVGSNALVVDSSGRVGIGTTSPVSSSLITLKKTNNGGDGAEIRLVNSSITVESSTQIVFTNTNSDSANSAVIKVARTNLGQDFRFSSDGTERMRIDGSGKVLVGGISAEPSGGFGGILFGAQSAGNNASFKTTASANVGASIVSIRDTDGIQISFHQGGSYIGSITTNGSNTAFNTSSDYRLKENITEITDGITRVKQLNPFRFNFIANPENTVDGFIAHEVQDIVPEAITGVKDAVNEDGSINPQGIDQSKLVPLLTAALQEAIALIESQQSQIDALTTKTQEQDFTIASLISRIEALENP